MRRRGALWIASATVLSACASASAPCPDGTWDDDGDAATECVAWSDCEAGERVAREGTEGADRGCVGCPSGTFSRAPNAATCEAWTTCAAGFFVVQVGSASRDRSCARCAAGTDTFGPNRSTCVPEGSCAPGTVQTAARFGDVPPVCEACVPGQHCPGGERAAVACGSGDGSWDHDADPATACAERTTCVGGSYVLIEGDATTDRSCAPCPSGTYSDGPNEASCAEWTTCLAGEYVIRTPSATADRACAACPTGTYTSGPNQSACVETMACPPGTLESAPGSPTSPPMCEPCSAGEHCPGGVALPMLCGANDWDHDADPATACAARTDCGVGQYVEDDGSATSDRRCVACAAESYSDAVNASACTAWTVCDAGYLEVAPGTDTADRSCAAPWTRQFGTHGADNAHSVFVDGSGNVLVAGSTAGVLPGQRSAGHDDAFVQKYDATGALVWTRQFGSIFDDSARAVTAEGSGNVVVAGSVQQALPGATSVGSYDAFVRMYDPDGGVLWTRQFGTADFEVALAVSVEASGSIIVAGYTWGAFPGQTLAGRQDAWGRKYDAAGTELWTRQFGTTDSDYAYAVTTDGSGNVILAGYTEGVLPGSTGPGSGDAYVRKYDPSGTLLWTRQFGTVGQDSAYGVIADASGDVVVVGETSGALPGETSVGGRDAFVRRLGADGSVLWTRQIGTSGHDGARAVTMDGSANVIVVGTSERSVSGSAADTDAYVWKLDAAGAPRWTRQFGSTATDIARSVTADASANVLVAGHTAGTPPGQTSAGGIDAFVMRLLP